jgi:patatin-like phospholipase/acyl hydrolase
MCRKIIIIVIFTSLFFSVSCGGPAIKPDSPVSSPVPQAPKRTIRILAIDGGGIRGIIPAVILSEIEKRTQKPVSELFDLVVGTSTGGILALFLVKPNNQGRPQYTAKDLVAMYEKEGDQIFSRSIWQKIHSGGSLVGEKYPASGIEKVLEKYFDKARLKDSLTEVLITSYDIERRIPFFFKSRNAKANISYDFPLKQVARATSAAPT